MNTEVQFYTTGGAITIEGQNAVSNWLEDKVLYCQSMLVSDLLNEFIPNSQHCYGWDEVENLYDDSMEAVEEFLTYCDSITDDERETIWGLPFDEREKRARELGWEPDPQEIYEWWLVSDYFAARLREAGEPIFEGFGSVWWGRCTTGQWLGMDRVIVDLARDAKIIK